MNQTTSPSEHSSGKNFLFAIAIDEYQNLTPSSHRVTDLKKSIQILSSQFHFSKNETYTLFNQEATTQNIYKKFEELIGVLTDDDNLIIYFSGQGEYKAVFNQGYWVPVNAESGNVAQYIPNSEIFTILNSLPAKHILLLTDSCFSVSFFDEEDLPEANASADLGSRWIISAQRNSIVTVENNNEDAFNKSVLQYLEDATSSISVIDLQKNILANITADDDVDPMGGALTIAGHEGGLWSLKIKPNEEKDWTTVIRENTIVGYQSYLTRFPEGKYRAEATQRMTELKNASDKTQVEEEAWKNAMEGNSIASFLEYKKKFPKGKYSAEADSKIAIISIGGSSSFSISKEETPKATNKEIPPVPKKLPPKKFGMAKPIEEKERNPLPPINIDWGKYGKWAAMILLPIALLWGGYQFIPSSEPSDSTDLDRKEIPKTPVDKPVSKDIPKSTTELETTVDDSQDAPQEDSPEVILPDDTTIENPSNNITQTPEPIPEQEPTPVENPNAEAIRLLGKANAYFQNKNWSKAKEYYVRANAYDYEKELITQRIKACDENQAQANMTTTPKNLTPIQTLERNMMPIRGGTFTMGSEAGEPDEQPMRAVQIKSFRMSKFEVTQDQYQAIMKTNPSANQCNYCPVENVSYEDVQKFLKLLNTYSGKNYRLPTEAEWEYAARGKDDYKFAGSNSINGAGWHSGNSSGKTQGTGRKARNGFGLFDMSGNVAEWCLDWYDENYYQKGINNNPRNTTVGPAGARVIRGGSFMDKADECRVTNRKLMGPRYGRKYIGFRVVLD